MVVVTYPYGIAESGAHRWSTYFEHHCNVVSIQISTFEPCLVISKRPHCLGLIQMQTNDTLGVSDKTFAAKEDQEIKFTANNKEYLTSESRRMFNGCSVLLSGDDILLRQKNQVQKLAPIVDNAWYILQRARGTYLASIFQTEAIVALSTAAQVLETHKEDIVKLDQGLTWQKCNLEQGLRNIHLGIENCKLFAMVESSPVNNKDLSSQMGYIIILGIEGTFDGHSKRVGNIVRWSSKKCKQVARIVLPSEFFDIEDGMDMAVAIETIIGVVKAELGFPSVPIVVCTDYLSLY